jgi:hypothetical protein
VQPAAREVEGVPRAEGDIVSRGSGSAELLLVALSLQRQRENRLVDEPALLTRDLEYEDVVRVVVDGQALGVARRVIGVRLRRMAELTLELAAEDGQRLPVDVQTLEDDRGAGFEFGEDAVDVGRPRERLRPPGNVDGVVVEPDLRPLLDETKGRVADSGRADEPLDVGFGQEGVEAPGLCPGDDERLLLPVLAQELLGGDRVETVS